MSAPIYRLENLAKDYNGRRVLDIEALEIQDGEILTLVGPSGAGKSTLLRLLNFLEPPSQGSILYRHARFRPGMEMPLDLRRKVTTVFQSPILLNQSVRDNVAYGLRLRGQEDSQPAVRAALEQVGLAHLAHQPARTLSGGEAQRVALARAIVLAPEVLLMDEPTANLDPYNVGLIETIVQALNRDRGTTIVLVTHNVFQARRLAQRAAFMLDGRLVEVAAGADFFQNAQDPRTAAFVRGEMVY